MMGTNDTGYINKVAIGGHIALDTVLLISYVVELLKGSRTLSYFLVVAAFMIIPIAVELAIYSKKKDAASIRHILAITYGVFYLFAIFTTNSISTFVYILPFFILLTVYSDIRYVSTIAFCGITSNIAWVIWKALTTGIPSEQMPDVEIRLACMIICSIFIQISTRVVKKINDNKLHLVEVQQEKNQTLMDHIIATSEGMVDQIEEAYRIYGSGEFYMPPRPTVEHENKQLMYMPCYTKDIIGTKILSIFPENSKLGLPSIDGIVLLNDYTTGAPLAVMDGQSVTAWRTGAVGGVGIRRLSRKDCHTVGIIGAGMQGFHQAVYACAARDIHTVYVFNHSDRDLTDYLERLKKAIDKEDVKVVQCKAVEELVRNSDIICTTTPSTTPVLPDDKELLRGKCIIAIGSYMPEMREIPDAVLDLVDNVYIELPYACEESGDLSQPLASGKLTKDRVKLMHEYLVSGEKEIKEGQTTYFKSVGMGLFDVCIAQKLFEVAKEK